jgi:hypothetical protein
MRARSDMRCFSLLGSLESRAAVSLCQDAVEGADKSAVPPRALGEPRTPNGEEAAIVLVPVAGLKTGIRQPTAHRSFRSGSRRSLGLFRSWVRIPSSASRKAPLDGALVPRLREPRHERCEVVVCACPWRLIARGVKRAWGAQASTGALDVPVDRGDDPPRCYAIKGGFS